MDKYVFAESDVIQINARGITVEEVLNHLEMFRKGHSYLTLERACTIGDGIVRVEESEIDELHTEHQRAADRGSLLKFVPASGAASRMFKALLWVLNRKEELDLQTITRTAGREPEAQEVVRFAQELRHFAFFADLEGVMKRDGMRIDNIAEKGQLRRILKYLLTERGLNYAGLPKGLLAFHQYPEGPRTAFEEHLVETAHYITDAEGIARIHLTVSPEHRKEFERLIEKTKPIYEKKYNLRFKITLSFQNQATDIIAVDMNNAPLRDQDGRLVFRPGGHGALIENLNETEADIIYIKNIDNVVPDRLKPETYIWKKNLGGYLLKTQKRIFNYLQRLDQGGEDRGLLEEILTFAREKLYIIPPEGKRIASPEEKRAFLFATLNRPIRVCGMVPNAGEPGGGPFWVRGNDGSLSLQIVESAQVDTSKSGQKQIWQRATHFNPVDIVCGVYDFRGSKFDLKHYIDQKAVFIARKSKDGRELKALELPGLWNGAMADWITLFVEVPIITFNPVKTVNDLLRAEHQS
ncbi:MAG: DUF4301 family protein [Deltaproteobacteria bacterium]|nr:DUF4301 family protein [Deltaproteobacteria bacterium]